VGAAGQAQGSIHLASRAYQSLRAIYHAPSPQTERRLAETLIDTPHICLPMPEITRLARTVRQWRDQILAYVATGGVNNGGTEALNLIIDKIRRLATASATSPTTDYASCSRHTEPGPTDNDPPMLNPEELDYASGSVRRTV
jgi:hypothetical protein